MTEYREELSPIVGYDGQILFGDAAERKAAEWLAVLTGRKFAVEFLPPSPSGIVFRLAPDRFAEIASFMAMNRNGLQIMFHPRTERGRNEEALIGTYYGGPRAAKLVENPNRPVSWHFHIYFPSAEIAKAHWLHDAIARRFRVAIYPVEDGAGGPHPMPNLEVQVGWDELPKILPWLALNRQGLSVHVHPRSEDLIADHVDWPLWLGTPVRLIEAELDGLRPPGADEGLEHVNGAPREPPSPDKRFPPTA